MGNIISNASAAHNPTYRGNIDVYGNAVIEERTDAQYDFEEYPFKTRSEALTSFKESLTEVDVMLTEKILSLQGQLKALEDRRTDIRKHLEWVNQQPEAT